MYVNEPSPIYWPSNSNNAPASCIHCRVLPKRHNMCGCGLSGVCVHIIVWFKEKNWHGGGPANAERAWGENTAS